MADDPEAGGCRLPPIFVQIYSALMREDFTFESWSSHDWFA
jgi:hypothetical protein